MLVLCANMYACWTARRYLYTCVQSPVPRRLTPAISQSRPMLAIQLLLHIPGCCCTPPAAAAAAADCSARPGGALLRQAAALLGLGGGGRGTGELGGEVVLAHRLHDVLDGRAVPPGLQLHLRPAPHGLWPHRAAHTLGRREGRGGGRQAGRTARGATLAGYPRGAGGGVEQAMRMEGGVKWGRG